MQSSCRFRWLKQDCQGMTLVEIMVAMVIVSIIGGIVYNVSLTQMQSVNEAGSVLESSGSPSTGLELIKRDIALAGYGTVDIEDKSHLKNMAFLIADGGSGPDKLYLFDGSYIDVNELAYDFYGELGYSLITAGLNSSSITLERLDLDNMTSQYDDAYTSDSNEFMGGIRQYVITNSTDPARKTAQIVSISGETLTLDGAVRGDKVGPAVYYCVDVDGTDSSCHPSGGATHVLRRSSRRSDTYRDSSANVIDEGILSVAESIVDMQIAYKMGNTWYCDGAGSCPLDPFYAGEVDLIRISLVVRVGTIPSSDPAYANTTAVENGPSWGNDGSAYRVFTTSIRPRNNIEFH